MFLIRVAAGMTFLAATPANADISALYEVGSVGEGEPDFNFGMTVEVNDAGDARIHLTGRSSYLLVKQGDVFLVSRGIDGVYAERLSDMDTALKANGQMGGISFEFLDDLNDTKVKNIGKTKVGNWKGTGFSLDRFSYESEERPDLVMSDDASLAELAPAFRSAFAGKYGMAKTLSLAGVPIALYLMSPKVKAVFDKGTPIKLGMLELTTISRDEINPDRFALPERVLSQEDIENYLEPFKWAPAFDVQPAG
jgi:hypothetical protein